MSMRIPRAKVGPAPAAAQKAPNRWVWCLLLLVSLSSGCRGFTSTFVYNDVYDEVVLGWRDYTWARRAWNVRKQQFCNQPAAYDFRAGFIDGYIDVANGGNGCTPSMPPQKYWSWKYQSAEGQAKVAAWFAGYPHGARAAEEDGAGNYRMIQVAPELVERYQRQDPNHPLNQAFYENLPVQEVLPQPIGPAAGPAPHLSPAPWTEVQGSGMQPPAGNPAAPYIPAPLNDEPTVIPPPQQLPPGELPPIPEEEGSPVPVLPGDGFGVLPQEPIQFPTGVIPLVEPADWVEAETAPAAAEPAPPQPAAPVESWEEATSNTAVPSGLRGSQPGQATLQSNVFPSMVELLKGMPLIGEPSPADSGLARPASAVGEPGGTTAEAEGQDAPQVSDELQTPAMPPALLQQPLGAPLFQSPDR